jgi:hypothetical protein
MCQKDAFPAVEDDEKTLTLFREDLGQMETASGQDALEYYERCTGTAPTDEPKTATQDC